MSSSVYELDNYPFDKQTCSIDIRTSDHFSSTLRLRPKKLGMEQSVDMTLFLMEHWELVYKNESAPEEGVSMTIVLRRKILSEMMGTYLPSILLMMIKHAGDDDDLHQCDGEAAPHLLSQDD